MHWAGDFVWHFHKPLVLLSTAYPGHMNLLPGSDDWRRHALGTAPTAAGCLLRPQPSAPRRSMPLSAAAPAPHVRDQLGGVRPEEDLLDPARAHARRPPPSRGHRHSRLPILRCRRRGLRSPLHHLPTPLTALSTYVSYRATPRDVAEFVARYT